MGEGGRENGRDKGKEGERVKEVQEEKFEHNLITAAKFSKRLPGFVCSPYFFGGG